MKKPQTIMILLFFVSFVQTAVFGCFNPIFSMYLKDYLHFTGGQTGMIIGLSGLASILSTLIVTGVTSKTGTGIRKMLIILHSMAIFSAVIFTFQKSFYPVLFIYIIYTFSIIPTVGLINGLIFSSLGKKRNRYGLVRLGGTAGWITSGWAFGFFYMRLLHNSEPVYLSHAYYFAAVFSALVIILVSRVPKPESEIISKSEILKKKNSFSISWLQDPKVRNIIIIFLAAGMVDVFYYFGAGPYFKMRGVSEADISPLMTLGQITEVCSLFFLERIVKKIGYKRTIIIGLIMQTLRYILFSIGVPFWALPIVVMFHGPVIAFLYMTTTMMIDALVDDEIRSTVHQIISMLWIGFASFSGNILAGFSMDFFTSVNGTVKYFYFWIIPAFVTMAALFMMLFLVKRERELSSKACATTVNADVGGTVREKY